MLGTTMFPSNPITNLSKRKAQHQQFDRALEWIEKYVTDIIFNGMRYFAL